jgi:hypothetical protein
MPMTALNTAVAKPAARNPRRRFFVVMSYLFLVLSVVGFAPSFFIDPPVPYVAIGHGVLMAAWLGVFIMQARLVAAGNVNQHRRLGTLSVALAVVIWLSMAIASFAVLDRLQPALDSYLYDVLMVQLVLMVLFTGFVTWGYLARRDSASHKRLMALSTLLLVQAALDRMSWQPVPVSVLVWILLIPFWIFDLLSLRRVHRVTLIATGMIVASHVAVSRLWGWPAWHQFFFDLMHAT